jgi:hypothetical protein
LLVLASITPVVPESAVVRPTGRRKTNTNMIKSMKIKNTPYNLKHIRGHDHVAFTIDDILSIARKFI